MKTVIVGLAALCLGTVGLACSSSPGCDLPDRSAARAAPASPFAFSSFSESGRWVGSPV